MAKIIEAKAVISGEDRLSKVLDGLNRKFKSLGKGAKIAADIEGLNKALTNTQRQLQAIERINAAQGKLQTSRLGLAGAQAQADRAAMALSAARKANDAKAVAELTTQSKAAQRAVTQATGAVERQTAAVRDAKRAFADFGVPVSNLVAHERALRGSVEQTTAAIRKQATEQKRLHDLAERQQGRREAGMALAGGAGLYLGHKVKEGTQATLHTYRDFDKYKRQTQAFGNFSDEETARIVDMAIHGGATTRYNDIQWLQGAKALGGRGVNAGSVMGILPEAAQYGQAMSVDLPEAVTGMEASLFAFRRDLSSVESATRAARRTADLQVSAAKAFGLTHEDLKGGYEYGALSAEMTGLGEEKLLAFLGLGKKLNIDGRAQGNAFNAMAAKYLAPTRKGREALSGVGIDYSSYQKMPDRLSLDNFASMVAQQYGVKLDKGARAKLEKTFTDQKTFTNASAYAIAVKDALKGQIGISNARDANKVTGAAERFRQNNVEKVDVNGLADAILEKIAGGNLALANAIWGEKQGKRVMAAIRDGDEWRKAVKKMEGTPEGKAKGVADAINAGFDGALARFENSKMNVETAFGRAWDGNGDGGFLTALADAAGKATQALAELPKPALMAVSGLAWVGGKAASASGTLALVGAAFSLKTAAGALTVAAARLGGAGVVGAGAKAGAGAAAGAAGGAAARSTAAGAGGAATGGVLAGAATGVILGGGAIGGAILGDAMPKAMEGGESIGSLGNRYLDMRKRIAANEAQMRGSVGYTSPTWARRMPGAASTGMGFPTTMESSRGVLGDLVMGPRQTNVQLPSFGAGNKQMPGPLPSRAVPLPPQRPADLGPITAEVKSPVPVAVTGEGTVTVNGEQTVHVVFNTAMFEAAVTKIVNSAVSKMSFAANGPGSTGKSSPDAGKGMRD